MIELVIVAAEDVLSAMELATDAETGPHARTTAPMLSAIGKSAFASPVPVLKKHLSSSNVKPLHSTALLHSAAQASKVVSVAFNDVLARPEPHLTK